MIKNKKNLNKSICENAFNVCKKPIGKIPFLDNEMLGIEIKSKIISDMNYEIEDKLVEKQELWLLTTGELIEVKAAAFFGEVDLLRKFGVIIRVITKRDVSESGICKWDLNEYEMAMINVYRRIFSREQKDVDYDYIYGLSFTNNDHMVRYKDGIVAMSYIIAGGLSDDEALKYFSTQNRLEIIHYVQYAISPYKMFCDEIGYNNDMDIIKKLLGENILDHVMDNIELYDKEMRKEFYRLPPQRIAYYLRNTEYNMLQSRNLYSFYKRTYK